MANSPIYVTKTRLPPLGEYVEYLEKIWRSNWVTNNGILHIELEEALLRYLDVSQLSLFCNGTMALLSALHGLRIQGEVITTPFTFPATVNVLYWNNVKPVFCDIEPDRLTIDASRIEALLTPKTTAILGVHVFGNPCDVEALEDIGKRHGVRIIYDAAHAFGVKKNGEPLSHWGDAVAYSFHATKTFHTIEGGALVVRDEDLKRRVDCLKNFGIVDEETVITPGINGKLNELQAAMGLLQLKYITEEIERRRRIFSLYSSELDGVRGVKLILPAPDTGHNYSYVPVLVQKSIAGKSRDDVHAALKTHNVHCRKYFYPLCSDYPFLSSLPSATRENLPVATRVAQQILCLPMFGELEDDQIKHICKVIRWTIDERK